MGWHSLWEQRTCHIFIVPLPAGEDGAAATKRGGGTRVQRVVDCRWRGNKFYNAAKGGRKERSPLPIEPYVAQWKAPIVPPAELGERWWRQPPKGAAFPSPARAVVWFYTNWRPTFLKAPTTAFAPCAKRRNPWPVRQHRAIRPSAANGRRPLREYSPPPPLSEATHPFYITCGISRP